MYKRAGVRSTINGRNGRGSTARMVVWSSVLPTPQDKRRFGRAPFIANVTVELPAGGSAIDARSVDISLGGVGLISPMPVPVGEHMVLTFHLKTSSGMTTERIPGRVVNLRHDDDASIVGVEFAAVLDHKTAPVLTGIVEKL
jgi:c-di-GMP-binding flagellar brake protein YcgR